MSALDDIAAERRRQIDGEVWNHEHDDSHIKGEMAVAAACYALYDTHAYSMKYSLLPDIIRKAWPWSMGWWKPKSPRRNLVRAAALLVAEIDRLDRRSGGNAEI